MLLSGCHITLILVDLGNLAVSNNLRTLLICCVGRCMMCPGNLFLSKIVFPDWNLIHIAITRNRLQSFLFGKFRQKNPCSLSLLDFRNETNKL